VWLGLHARQSVHGAGVALHQSNKQRSLGVRFGAALFPVFQRARIGVCRHTPDVAFDLWMVVAMPAASILLAFQGERCHVRLLGVVANSGAYMAIVRGGVRGVIGKIYSQIAGTEHALLYIACSVPIGFSYEVGTPPRCTATTKTRHIGRGVRWGSSAHGRVEHYTHIGIGHQRAMGKRYFLRLCLSAGSRRPRPPKKSLAKNMATKNPAQWPGRTAFGAQLSVSCVNHCVTSWLVRRLGSVRFGGWVRFGSAAGFGSVRRLGCVVRASSHKSPKPHGRLLEGYRLAV